jgi:hypothetical protein
MKNIATFLFIFSSLLLQAQTREEEELLKLNGQKFGWLINKQYDSLNRLLDDQLLYIHSSGMTETKNELIENLKTGKLSYTKVDHEGLRARIFNDTGIITGKAIFTGALDGKPFETHLYYTEVYVKVKKQWKLASRHASRLTP